MRLDNLKVAGLTYNVVLDDYSRIKEVECEGHWEMVPVPGVPSSTGNITGSVEHARQLRALVSQRLSGDGRQRYWTVERKNADGTWGTEFGDWDREVVWEEMLDMEEAFSSNFGQEPVDLRLVCSRSEDVAKTIQTFERGSICQSCGKLRVYPEHDCPHCGFPE